MADRQTPAGTTIQVKSMEARMEMTGLGSAESSVKRIL